MPRFKTCEVDIASVITWMLAAPPSLLPHVLGQLEACEAEILHCLHGMHHASQNPLGKAYEGSQDAIEQVVVRSLDSMLHGTTLGPG